jgi:predicted PurR-regulated permease PerM
VATLNETIVNLTDELIKSASAPAPAPVGEVTAEQLKGLVQTIYGTFLRVFILYIFLYYYQNIKISILKLLPYHNQQQ